MAQNNLNSGVLRKNDKQGVEARPDYKGRLNVGGIQYWISGWNKENDKGAYVSLSVNPMVGSRESVIDIGDPGPRPTQEAAANPL